MSTLSERRELSPVGGSRLAAWPLIVLLSAHGLSLVGNAVTVIVVPLYVLQLTGSVAATGVAGAFATVPMIIGGALGGVLVDRFGFRRAAVVADVASGVTVLAIPLLALTIGMSFSVLLLLVFLSGLLDTPGRTAKEALVPDLAAKGDVQLTRATAASSAISRSAMLIGASLASVLLVSIGALNSLFADAVTFAVSAVLIGVVLPRSATSETTAPEGMPPASVWAEFVEGVRYAARTPIIRSVVILVVVTNLIDAAGFLVLFPVFTRTVTQDGSLFGLVMGCFAGGAVVGAVTFAKVGHRLPRRALLIGGFLIAGPVPYLAMFAMVSPATLLMAMAVAGLAAGAINPLLTSTLYKLVPRELRARVLGVLTTGVTAGMPLGSLLAGSAVELWGLAPVLLSAAAVYGVFALSPLFGKSWLALKRA
ncbi:MFS transporter [Salinibacterium sp. TMP30]|uniref:MFS transporter n=1 Tax=Salinibacterium sp. TMP30 TaxID=3138237 RepID=UPI00313A10B1